jgi:hypothetical protein
MNPIFVHASPRSASTYFFAVLRRIESLMCFNEAIIDVFSYYGKNGVARFKAGQKWNVNHHFLERDDFAEFVEAWDSVMHLYPMFPSFQDYLPPNGVLPDALHRYLAGLIAYAQSRNKRAALCEIHSRGRAGALRNAFGGFHIAQYRDPLSQFGSFFRPLSESGRWNFLAFPLLELGISGNHPLYSVVPQAWRVPVLPWPADNGAQRWSSAIQYMAMVASPRTDTIEKAFRWHLFSWVLTNLAAVCYSDFVLDIDKAYDDSGYRQSVSDTLASEIGVAPNFSDLAKFSRYYQFETLDMPLVCDQVVTAIKAALRDGRIERAIGMLGQQRPTIAVEAGVDLLLTKISGSLASIEASVDCSHVSVEEWNAVVHKNKMIWFNPTMRKIAQRVYPLGSPIVRAARRAGVWR